MLYKTRQNPFTVVQMFEEELAEYCGSPYAVATDSCTNALFLCCTYLHVEEVTIPHKTYLSVPQSIMHAGGRVRIREYDWQGLYQLEPYPIYDSALRLTSGMYIPGSYMCLSFHHKKRLPIGKGGAILTDDPEAVRWLKKARYEGRSEMAYWDDTIEEPGWNMYMTPTEAATGLTLMQNLHVHNEDIREEKGYRDLREFLIFLKASVLHSLNILLFSEIPSLLEGLPVPV